MNRHSILSLTALAALGLALLPTNTVAQQKTLKEQLAGTWILVSYDSIGADGSKRPIFSAKPEGTLMLDGTGHYATVLVNPERPKKWSGNSRDQVNTEDLASAARGLVAQFGTWSVDETGKTLTRKIVGALNPLNAGREQKIQVSLSGDQLTLADPSSGVAGGRTETMYRRAK